MFYEQNPVFDAYNYRNQDMHWRENQYGPTYKTWQQSDYYEKPLPLITPKLDYYAEKFKPVYDFNDPFRKKFGLNI